MRLEEYNEMQKKLTEIFYENKKFCKGKELLKFKKDILYIKKCIKHEFDREKTGIYTLSFNKEEYIYEEKRDEASRIWDTGI